MNLIAESWRKATRPPAAAIAASEGKNILDNSEGGCQGDEDGEPYSRFQHLIDATRPSHDPEHLRVAAVTAYFDASGKASNSDSVELVVSGFVSTVKKWRLFERQWLALLKEAGVPYFHMKEFAPSIGIFKDWKDKEKKRRKFLAQLIDIVIEHTEQSFAAGVLLKDWRWANRLYMLREEDFQPYSLCGWTCIDEVYRWCDDNQHPRSETLFMFECGDEHEAALCRRVRKDFGIRLQFGGKIPDPKCPNEIPIVPLQAADFAAWHVRRELDKLAIGNPSTRTNVRWDFNELFSQVPTGKHHRHFSMTAATPVESKTGVIPRSLGVPSLPKFCVEFGHVPPRR